MQRNISWYVMSSNYCCNAMLDQPLSDSVHIFSTPLNKQWKELLQTAFVKVDVTASFLTHKIHQYSVKQLCAQSTVK